MNLEFGENIGWGGGDRGLGLGSDLWWKFVYGNVEVLTNLRIS